MRRWMLWLVSTAWAATAMAAPPAPDQPMAAATAPASSTTQADKARAGKTAKPAPGKAIDRVELDQTTITGNRELPNVMVIVPWKESSPGSVSPASRSLLEDALAPLDREEFRRELQYREALQPTPSSPSKNPPN